MKAIICGTGKMGTAIAYAMLQLGYDVEIVEKSPQAVRTCMRKLGYLTSYQTLVEVPFQPNIVISALPYFENDNVAKFCIEKGVRYCDLGGSVPVSKSINSFAQVFATKPVMTDIGLAPGWINIMAEHCVQKLGIVKKVGMMVGGIPQNPDDSGPLKYLTTWSIEGLLNEYLDDCEILRDGQRLTVLGMDGLETVHVGGRQLEAFYTSGATAYSIDSMQQRGVQSLEYKTLRYPGHCEIVRWLLYALDSSAMKTLFQTCEQNKPDIVVMRAYAEDGNMICSQSRVLEGENGFTAMQRCTAFPLAVVADMLARGMFDHKKVVGYSDIPLDEFAAKLKELGLGEDGQGIKEYY